MENKKVLFADLDGTLINTITGSVFPRGIWDMQLRFDVLKVIKCNKFRRLIIVSNQGGIESGYVAEVDFQAKAEYLKAALRDYLGIPVEYLYCTSNDKDNESRKPNPGMLKTACDKFLGNRGMYAVKENMLMIGDASGKAGQFSDSDRKTAENFGIDYIDVDDFYLTR